MGGRGEPCWPHPELRVPYLAGSYSWCPPQRMLGQGQVGRSWCHRKLLPVPNPDLVSSPLLQVFNVFFFFRHCFSNLCFRSLLVILTAGCLTSRKAVWDQCALSPFGKLSHIPTLMVLLLPWEVEHPGSLPWAGWARTLCSCNVFVDTNIYKRTWIGWGELYCRQECRILWLVTLICISFKKLQIFPSDLYSSACFELLSITIPNIKFIKPQSSDVPCIHVVFQCPRIYY